MIINGPITSHLNKLHQHFPWLMTFSNQFQLDWSRFRWQLSRYHTDIKLQIKNKSAIINLKLLSSHIDLNKKPFLDTSILKTYPILCLSTHEITLSSLMVTSEVIICFTLCLHAHKCYYLILSDRARIHSTSEDKTN